MPILPPSNWFQLYNRKQADWQLAVNGSRMSTGEQYLWHNVEVMHKIIEEAGLEQKLQEAYQENLDNYAQIENERYARHKSQVDADRELVRETNRKVAEVLSEKKKFFGLF